MRSRRQAAFAGDAEEDEDGGGDDFGGGNIGGLPRASRTIYVKTLTGKTVRRLTPAAVAALQAAHVWPSCRADHTERLSPDVGR